MEFNPLIYLVSDKQRMLAKEFVDSFRNSLAYKKVYDAALKGELDRLLLGEGHYRVTLNAEKQAVVPSQIMMALHLHIKEGLLTNEDLNRAFAKLEINEKTICTLLAYIEEYQLYKTEQTLLRLDAEALWNRIGDSPLLFKTECARSLLLSILKKTLLN